MKLETMESGDRFEKRKGFIASTKALFQRWKKTGSEVSKKQIEGQIKRAASEIGINNITLPEDTTVKPATLDNGELKKRKDELINKLRGNK